MARITRAGYRPQSVKKRDIGRVGAGNTATGGFFNNLPAIIAAFPEVCAEIVIESTQELIAFAEQKAPRGETGKLATETRVTYRDAKGGVMARVDWTATDPSSTNPKHRYPFYQEVGTRDTAAQPFVVPAIVAERPRFHARLRDLERRLPG